MATTPRKSVGTRAATSRPPKPPSDSRKARPAYDLDGEGKIQPWQDDDEIPTIDKPPRPPKAAAADKDRGRRKVEAEEVPDIGRMLIPLIHGDMSDKQKGNQAKGVVGALAAHRGIQEQLPQIYALLDSASSDGAITAINKSMLCSSLELLPLAFQKYHDAPMDFNAYALGAMVNQIRALITDVQASKDRSLISERVNKVCIRGAFLLIVQHAADINTLTKAYLADKIKPGYEKVVIAELDGNLKAQARFMNENYEELAEQVSKLLTD